MPLIETQSSTHVDMHTVAEENHGFLPMLTRYIRTPEELQHIYDLRQHVRHNMPWDKENIDKAIITSVEAHYPQDRLTHETHADHVISSAGSAAEEEYTPEIVISLLLHDVLDDTELTSDDIQEHFGHKIADIVEVVSETGRRNAPAQTTAYRLLDAIAKYPQAIIVRVKEQNHNAPTTYLHNPELIDLIFRRTIDFIGPLAYAFGMRKEARNIINGSTLAKFPEACAKIIAFDEENNFYPDDILTKLHREIKNVVDPYNSNLVGIETSLPTLYDLVLITGTGGKLDKERMLLHLDIGYPQDPTMPNDLGNAAACYTRLCQKYGQPLVKTGKNFEFVPPVKDVIEELIKHGKLEYYHLIEGRLVHIRLIPKTQYDFEKVSLVPIFKIASTDKEALNMARKKLAKWQFAWKRWHRDQPKFLKVKEFVRFLQGEESVIIAPPKGKPFEMPVGSCAYDFIAALNLPAERKEELYLFAIKAKVKKIRLKADGSIIPEERVNPMDFVPTQALPSLVSVKIIPSQKRITLTPDVFDSLRTEDGQREVRTVVKKLMENDVKWRTDVRERGLDIITRRFYEATTAKKIDVPLEIGLAQVATNFKDKTIGWDQTQPEYYDVLFELLKEDVGLNDTYKGEEDVLETFIKALVDYRHSLIPVSVTTVDADGMDNELGAVFANAGIGIVRDESEFPGTGVVTLTKYIDPSDRDKLDALNRNLLDWRTSWEQIHRRKSAVSS